MKSKLFIIFFLVLGVWVILNRAKDWENKVFVCDESGYHLYLPAVFIYNDLAELTFYPSLESTYRPSGDEKWYSIHTQPNGRRLNKYAIGVSVMELPFFAAAHCYSLLGDGYPADGYSVPYQYGALLSNLLWAVVGLFFLTGVLRKYFSETVTLVTLMCIALGTNLYYQSIFAPGSHAYSFCLIAALLYFTDRWYRTKKPLDLYWLAIALGLITITRPINIVAVVIPLLWNIVDVESLKQRAKLLLDHHWHLLLAAMLFLLICMIQMGYWKYITGHWIYYSYQGEGFDFKEPEIINGLLSFRKGWFIYTPMAAIGFMGFFLVWKKYKHAALSTTVYFILTVYLVFSWRNWWYGGSFSGRPMVDSLAVLAFPLGSLIDYFFAKRSIHKIGFSFLLSFLILLNMFQTYQYILTIVHYDRMTAAYYWRVFGKLSVTEDDRTLLMNDHDYWQAAKEAVHD